jgi:hypothetical protein
MVNRNVLVALVAVGCITAAGVGGYLAVRLNSDAPAAVGLTEVALNQPVTPVPASAPVSAARTDLPPVPPAPVEAPAPVAARPVTKSPSSRPVSKAPAPVAPAPAPSPYPSSVPPATVPASQPDPVTPAAVEVVPEPVAPPPVPQPRKPEFEELHVKTDSVIGIRLDTTLNSKTTRVEDRVTARVTRDVMVDGRTAIPAGARLEGTVTLVERGGNFRQRARLGVRFTSIVLADKTRLPIETETIFRDGESPSGEATSKIGAGAVVGAMIGAMIGGKKGAAIGSAAGVGGGTAAVMAGGPNDATLEAGTPLTVRLTSQVTVTVEKPQNNDGE